MIMENIAKTVAEYYGIWFPHLFSDSKKRHIVQVRQMAMYIARFYAKMGVSEIAVYFGKTHSTTISACRKAENDMFSSVKYKKEMQEIIEKAKQYFVIEKTTGVCHPCQMMVYKATG